MQKTVLEQMLKPAIQAPEADPAVDGLAGVLGKAASVSALAELDVQLEARSRAARQCKPEDFVETLPQNALFLRVECETEGQFGLLSVDPELINSIVNVLTGELVKGEDMPARPPTAIDIALCRPYLDALFEEFADILLDLREGKPTDRYHTGPTEPEPSPHMFPEIPYLEIGIDFDFASGAGGGHLSLMIPTQNTDFTSALPRPGETASAWRVAFNKALQEAPVSFDVVLYRKKMPIGRIMKLKSGDMLKIPSRALESLSIESRKGALPQSLMRARLGEYQDMRAAKITRIGAETAPSNGPKLLETPPEPAKA